MDQYKNNIFTSFVNNSSLTNTIMETNHTLVFYDKFPKAKFHCLIIPKGHYINMNDFLEKSSLEEKTDFQNILLKVIKHFGLDKKGYNIQINTNESHGQLIFHYHVHLLSNG